jgi:hypothetical protein
MRITNETRGTASVGRCHRRPAHCMDGIYAEGQLSRGNLLICSDYRSLCSACAPPSNAWGMSLCLNRGFVPIGARLYQVEASPAKPSD